MTEPNPCCDATYTDVTLEPEKEVITDLAMRRFMKLDRDLTIARLRGLDKALGREQTIPRRVR